MKPQDFDDKTPAEFRQWLDSRADAIAEKVRSTQWGDAVGMLKDGPPSIAGLVFGRISDFERVRLECRMLESDIRWHGFWRKQLLRDRRHYARRNRK